MTIFQWETVTSKYTTISQSGLQSVSLEGMTMTAVPLPVCLSVPLASLSFPLQIIINSHFSLALTLFGDKNIIEPTTNERTGWGTSTPLMSPISCLWLIDGLPSRHSFNGHCLYTISPERSWQARNGTATARRRRPLRRRKSINFSVSALFTSFNLFNCF